MEDTVIQSFMAIRISYNSSYSYCAEPLAEYTQATIQ